LRAQIGCKTGQAHVDNAGCAIQQSTGRLSCQVEISKKV
jgi:hypothetical protein